LPAPHFQKEDRKMAVFDLSQAKVAVDLSNPDFVNFGSFVSSTPNFWDWLSVAGHRLDIIGGGMTYSGGHATAGTVSAIGFDLGNDSFNTTELTITGLNFSAVTLDDGADSFWRILDGNDTITGPLLANIAPGAISKIFGDGINARAGVTTGGNDNIDAGDTQVTVYGDVVNVGSQTVGAPAVTYTGGNDVISERATASRPLLVGDAESVFASGRLNGGDDIFTLRSTAIYPEAIGDALIVEGVAGNFAEVFGGDDTFDATQMAVGTADFGASMVGDVASQRGFASVTGGADKMFGSNGKDNLTGDCGNNSGIVIGGADEFHGYDGDDNIVGEVFNASGTIFGGNDIMFGGNGADRMFGEFANGSGIILNGGDDKMYGEAGADFMRGQSGNDLLDGGTGIDAMEGGTGNDTYYVDDALDVTNETNLGGGIGDYVFASVSYTAAAGIERLYLTGAGDINATGSAGQNDILIGNSGKNYLDGLTGSDVMRGGLGDDRYFVDNAGDTTDEVNGGGGIADYVFATVSFAAAQGIERLYLQGAGNINATGRAAQNDILVGNDGANILNGLSGNDLMRGGLGNDTYFVDSALDTTDEVIGGGGIADFVFASVSYTAAAGIERLILTGASAINGTGRDAQNDILIGNSAANTLLGLTGNDVLIGGFGNDALNGGAGLDTFRFDTALNAAANMDTITGFVAADDAFQIDNSVFTALAATGALAANLFKNLNLAPIDADDRILYNDTTGAVLYDADGSGAGAAVQFALLTANPTISAADFVVI
jgi:Ca2+-binding RTX toxin-like protein